MVWVRCFKSYHNRVDKLMAKGSKIIATLNGSGEPDIVFEGLIDPLEVQTVLAFLRIAYFSQYMDKMRQEELANEGVRKKEIEY